MLFFGVPEPNQLNHGQVSLKICIVQRAWLELFLELDNKSVGIEFEPERSQVRSVEQIFEGNRRTNEGGFSQSIAAIAVQMLHPIAPWRNQIDASCMGTLQMNSWEYWVYELRHHRMESSDQWQGFSSANKNRAPRAAGDAVSAAGPSSGASVSQGRAAEAGEPNGVRLVVDIWMLTLRLTRPLLFQSLAILKEK